MSLTTRFLRPSDVPALMALEQRQWTQQQAADEATILSRILTWPGLCVGTFSTQSGQALASLFLKPVTRDEIVQASCWDDCARVEQAVPRRTRTLFGISFTSVDPDAAWRVFEFFWPHALKNGWRDIYLGSPIPGFRRAREHDERLDAQCYARKRRGGLPVDPQLRYYHGKGLREIVAVREGYFPHEESLDHAVVLRGRVPLSALWPLWRCMPLPALQSLSGAIRKLVSSQPSAKGPGMRARFFHALSLLLPSGEAFVIRAVQDWLADGPTGRQADEALRREAERFVHEELAHQRAHRLFNERLARNGTPVAPLLQRIESAVVELSGLGLRNRLALSAAFEHLTALVSAEVLREPAWLSHCDEAEARMWRWHCREELGHSRVVPALLSASGVGYGRRATALLLATIWLTGDVVRMMAAMLADDARGAGSRGWQTAARAAGFAATIAPGLLRMGAGWAGYLVPRLR